MLLLSFACTESDFYTRTSAQKGTTTCYFCHLLVQNQTFTPEQVPRRARLHATFVICLYRIRLLHQNKCPEGHDYMLLLSFACIESDFFTRTSTQKGTTTCYFCHLFVQNQTFTPEQVPRRARLHATFVICLYRIRLLHQNKYPEGHDYMLLLSFACTESDFYTRTSTQKGTTTRYFCHLLVQNPTFTPEQVPRRARLHATFVICLYRIRLLHQNKYPEGHDYMLLLSFACTESDFYTRTSAQKGTTTCYFCHLLVQNQTFTPEQVPRRARLHATSVICLYRIRLLHQNKYPEGHDSVTV